MTPPTPLDGSPVTPYLAVTTCIIQAATYNIYTAALTIAGITYWPMNAPAAELCTLLTGVRIFWPI